MYNENPSRLDSVGRAISGVELEVVDGSGEQLEAHGLGEIRARCPGLMLGYLDDPEASAKALRDGWLYTGDLGYRDEEGYWFLVGRRKNIIITGGINISPEEIEQCLLMLPSVSDVLVVGIDHPTLGQVPSAYVVLAEPRPTAAEMSAHCIRYLARHKVPVQFEVVDSLPRTRTGKIRRIARSA
jgi:long-chain acyl-CoA synthetase